MIIASSTYGMGDILLLTSVAKHIPDCEVHLQPEAEKYSRFFRNICSKIVITDNIIPLPEIGPGHYALRKLRALGMENKCYLPYVDISEEEKQDGLSIIKKYQNPIVFVGNVAKHWKKEREPSQQYFQDIINNLSEEHTVLQFGISSNFTEFKKTIPMVDICIDDLIKYYYAIGEFVGVDTGDTHLMLACGGFCQAHIPVIGPRISSLWNYESNKIHYIYF